MEVNAKNKKEIPEEPSYEQLKYWLDKAVSDNKKLIAQINEISHALNILPWLFKVVELQNNFDEDFVLRCTNSITSILCPVEPKEEDIEAAEATKD